ncbi:MAG: hypothetical protein KDD50_11290, partial [Bdellovibrionales bacterium]|nr:hypothetical protein [Bdellovibrionales bacterium]
MYEQGKDKSSADKLFLKNMLTLIDQDSNSKVLKFLRKANAYLYFFGVKIFGHLFFNKKSN